jgi:hypothetical protein
MLVPLCELIDLLPLKENLFKMDGASFGTNPQCAKISLDMADPVSIIKDE